MQIDKIALAGLIVGIVAGVAGIAGAAAAVIAAIYAKGSATQSELEKVQENTARTIEELAAVRSHVAQVDDHLKQQNDRHDLEAAASNVRIACSGEAWSDEDLPLTLTMTASDFILERIELTNVNNAFSGDIKCVPIDAHSYLAKVSAADFSRWADNGEPHNNSETRRVLIRATLRLGDQSTSKNLSGFATMTGKQRDSGPNSLYSSFRGEG